MTRSTIAARLRANPARGRMKLLPALLAGAIAASAQAAAAPAWVATATRAHDPQGAVHLAPMRAGELVHVVVSLKLRNKAQLDALTASLQAGSGTPLTSAQFLERHAPTATQAQAVSDYLRAQGFRNITVAGNRLLVEADGNAGAVKSAFHADLHAYDVGGRSAYANVTDAQVPASLGDFVLGVGGLQTVHVASVHAKEAVAAPGSVHTLSTIAGISIPNFSSIYGANTLPSATNATIGIITIGSLTQTLTDLGGFATQAGYPPPPVSTVVISTASTDTSGLVEWNMDTQSALATAGGTIKSMILYNAAGYTNGSLTAAYNRVVSDNKAKVINVSLGECETSNKNDGSQASDDQIFQSAVSQGQTFSVSSGDSGAWECGASAAKSQSYPAVSPYVMAIGGTTLSTNNGNQWAGETAWSCTSASSCQQSSLGGAGGGPSVTETAPSWQRNAGVLGSSTARGVPDISFDASPQSGALVRVNGAARQIGGTSLAAPLFTGFWARIQSANNNTLPFPAATLYQGAASHPSWFHDVTQGNQGYPAGVGWDYATGYGSLQVANFATAFTPVQTGPTAAFTDTVSGLTVTFTDHSTDVGGTISAYAWNFGDGTTSSVKSPVHSYAAAGTYTVTETVTDSNAKTNAKSASVTVSVPPPVSISLPDGATVTSISSPYYDPSATLSLGANGTAAGSGYAGDGPGSFTTSPAVSAWASNAPSTSGGSFEVIASQIGGNASPSGSALGAWLNLGGGASWTVNAYHANGCDTMYSTVLQLQFRDVSTHTVLGTRSVTLQAECDSSLGN